MLTNLHGKFIGVICRNCLVKLDESFTKDTLGLVARLGSLLNSKFRLDSLDFDENRQKFPGGKLDESLHLRC